MTKRSLSHAARLTLKEATGDKHIGMWIGNQYGAAEELYAEGLTTCEPEDGGGLWGKVALLNQAGLEARDSLTCHRSEH